MKDLEFVIALTDHRFLGKVFQGLLIRRQDRYYSVVRVAKPGDLDDEEVDLKPYEKELIRIMHKYSDDQLVKRFSRVQSVAEFYSSMKATIFEKQVVPFIEKSLFEVTRILMLSPVKLYLKDPKYSNLYEEDRIEVAPIFAKPEYRFKRDADHTSYSLRIFQENTELGLKGKNCLVIANDPCMLLHRNRLIAFEKLSAKKLLPFFEKDKVVVPNSIEEKYYSGFIRNTIRDYNTQAEGFDILEGNIDKSAVLSLEKNLQYEAVLLLRFHYASEAFLPEDEVDTAVIADRSEERWIFTKVTRDRSWEQDLVRKLEKAGLKNRNGMYTLTGLENVSSKDGLYYLVNWLNSNKDLLDRLGISLKQDKLEKSYYTGESSLEFTTVAKDDWFDVRAIVQFGDFKIPFIKLKKYILNDIREFELPNGEIAVLPDEWFERYRGLLPFTHQRGEKLEVGKHHFTLLNEITRDEDHSVLKKIEELTGNEKSKISVPATLTASLRHYQEDGYQWMYKLYVNGFGGCLADDMGLGKTLQTLTLLLKLKRSKGAIKIPSAPIEQNQLNLFGGSEKDEEVSQAASLIVVPTSLVHNWENEVKKFTPGLKIFKYVGTQRKKVENLEALVRYYDIIITTYGTVRNDSQLLASTEFFYLILDESQSIKNSASKTYKSVMELRAKHRLVITGTPIENSLSDLWSQMNFLNPGILGSLAFFKKTFITPIEKHANEEQQQKLSLMIRPFVLRRKKQDVAKDLPPLVEQIRYCPLDGEQHRLYEKEKSIIRNAILTQIEEEGMAKSAFVVLQGLTKLRQLANHPSLISENGSIESGKFNEIFRMLGNIVAEGHKVLIFSSFVSHLELIRKGIEERGWEYSMLTGKTVNREKVIETFQENEDNRIFLISLKAGGVGLNLTQADYVFITDPWWNPAAENQAINRAHRIGQDKHVFVYRFITENSIEEKIQQLKARKSSLADKFINSNDPFQSLTQEEIVNLLS